MKRSIYITAAVIVFNLSASLSVLAVEIETEFFFGASGSSYSSYSSVGLKVFSVLKTNTGSTINIPPEKKESISTMGIVAIDLLIPGGGFFYRGEHIHGTVFAVLKISSLYSLYYFYHDYKYRDSLYRSAKRANAAADPGHVLYFKDPDGGYKSVYEFKMDRERSAENIVLTAAANVFIYAVSVVLNLEGIEPESGGAIPSFNYALSIDEGVSEQVFTLKFTGRI